MGEQHRRRSQDRQIADYTHVDSTARDVASHRRHAPTRECKWPVATELLGPREKKARPKKRPGLLGETAHGKLLGTGSIFRFSPSVESQPPCVAHKPQVPTP